jgi:hypothetical protein
MSKLGAISSNSTQGVVISDLTLSGTASKKKNLGTEHLSVGHAALDDSVIEFILPYEGVKIKQIAGPISNYTSIDGLVATPDYVGISVKQNSGEKARYFIGSHADQCPSGVRIDASPAVRTCFKGEYDCAWHSEANPSDSTPMKFLDSVCELATAIYGNFILGGIGSLEVTCLDKTGRNVQISPVEGRIELIAYKPGQGSLVVDEAIASNPEGAGGRKVRKIDIRSFAATPQGVAIKASIGNQRYQFQINYQR